MLRKSLLFAIATTLFLSTGCATMFSSEKQDVKIRAYPPDAMVVINGKDSVGTNVTVPLSREQQHTIDVSKEGMGSKRVMVKQGLNPWFFVNILWGPFFWTGMLVDALTGHINELEPTDLTINLEAGGTVASNSGGSGTVTLGGGGTTTLGGGGVSLGNTQTQTTKPTTTQPSKPVEQKPATTPIDDRPKIARTMVGPGQKDWVVAVMNVEASSKTGFDKVMLLALSDQIRVYLAERGARVVDRSTQENALKGMVDEEKKKSYAACVDSSCQIPLGKALAASHILRSTIAKFGKACATNGELIDLKAEVTVAAGSARGECEEEALLYAAESLAEQLIAGSLKR